LKLVDAFPSDRIGVCRTEPSFCSEDEMTQGSRGSLVKTLNRELGAGMAGVYANLKQVRYPLGHNWTTEIKALSLLAPLESQKLELPTLV